MTETEERTKDSLLKLALKLKIEYIKTWGDDPEFILMRKENADALKDLGIENTFADCTIKVVALPIGVFEFN